MQEYAASPLQSPIAEALSRNATPGLFNRQVSLSFGRAMEFSALEQAWQTLSQQHGILRTSFRKTSAGDLAQREHQEVRLDLELLDWREVGADTLPAEWNTLVQNEAQAPFDLSIYPLSRMRVIALPNGQHHLLWTYHALLLDEIAVCQLLIQWLHCYSILQQGGNLPDFSPNSYAAVDFSALSPERSGQTAFWQNLLRNQRFSAGVSELPAPVATAEAGASSHRHALPRHTIEQIKQLTEESQSSLSAFFAVLWSIVTTRLQSEKTAVFDCNFSLRPRLGDQENAIAGKFDGVLPAAFAIQPQMSFADAVADMHRHFEALNKQAPVSPKSIAQWLSRQESELVNALFYGYEPVHLNDNIHTVLHSWSNVDARILSAQPYPLALTVRGQDRIELNLDFHTDRFSTEFVGNLLQRFLGLLDQALENPSVALGDLEFLSASEKKALQQYAANSDSSAQVQPVTEIFRRAVQNFTAKPALQNHSEESLSYSELDDYSDRLAQYLNKKNLPAGSLVGLCVSPTPWMPVALLGILKSGHACLPVDPTHAEASPKEIPEGKSCPFFICDSATEELLPAEVAEKLVLDRDWATVGKAERARKIAAPALDQPAIYLCPETGSRLPISHGTLAQAVKNSVSVLELNPDSRVLQLASLTTGAALDEILGTLLAGGLLVMQGESPLTTRTELHESFTNFQITHLRFTVESWSQWMHYLQELHLELPEQLRTVAIDGSHYAPCAGETWERLAAGRVALIKSESPFSLVGFGLLLSSDPTHPNSPSLLRPQEGMQVFHLNALGTIQPPGFIGEAFIGFPFLLPASDLITTIHPFHRKTGIPAWATHRSSFLTMAGEHCLADSPLDAQAMGPDAAATLLKGHPSVFDAVVGAANDAKGNSVLTAWVISKDSSIKDAPALRSYLASRLPANSVPSVYHFLPRFPLTSQGKIDHANLPSPDDAQAAPVQEAPGSALEEAVRRAVIQIRRGAYATLDEPVPELQKAELLKDFQEVLRKEGIHETLAALPSNPTIRALASSLRQASPTLQEFWSPLLPLQVEGPNQPIYLIHDLSGSLQRYHKLLTLLGPEQPVYGLEAKASKHPNKAHRTVSEMATCYMEAILAQNPDGPFCLVGEGFGAVVAFETAFQLREAGHDVNAVVLLDPQTPRLPEEDGWLTQLKKALPFGKLAPKKPAPRYPDSELDSSVKQLHADAESVYEFSIYDGPVHIMLPDFQKADAEVWLAYTPVSRIRYFQASTKGKLLEQSNLEEVAKMIRELSEPIR